LRATIGHRYFVRDVLVRRSVSDVVQGALSVDRVVEDDRVDDQAERAELFFLAWAVGLAQFAAAAMADVSRQSVAVFAAVELDEDGMPLRNVAPTDK
jgi:hypothetical protein